MSIHFAWLIEGGDLVEHIRSVSAMGWSYKRLWIMLIEKDLKRIDLKKLAGINAYTLARMGKNEPVHMEIIGKLCKALDCKVENIIEYVADDADNE